MAKFPIGARFRPDSKQLSHLRPNKATGPTINRGKGNNNAATPWKFIKAVENKFGPLGWDLAASKENSKVGFGHYFNEVDNALVRSWSGLKLKELAWLNPPFTNITPWAKKCAEEVQMGARILLLVPASMANWLWDWVVPFTDIYSVGRMVFDDCYDQQGKLITTVYPKDLFLCRYDWSAGLTGTGSPVDAKITRWRWQDGQ